MIVPYKNKGYYGYKDSTTGKIVIKSAKSNFIDANTSITLNGVEYFTASCERYKWNLYSYDTKANVVECRSKCDYYCISPYSDGFYRCETFNATWTYIDIEGNELVNSSIYTRGTQFREGFAFVQRGWSDSGERLYNDDASIYVIDNQGNEVFNLSRGYADYGGHTYEIDFNRLQFQNGCSVVSQKVILKYDKKDDTFAFVTIGYNEKLSNNAALKIVCGVGIIKNCKEEYSYSNHRYVNKSYYGLFDIKDGSVIHKPDLVYLCAEDFKDGDIARCQTNYENRVSSYITRRGLVIPNDKGCKDTTHPLGNCCVCQYDNEWKNFSNECDVFDVNGNLQTIYGQKHIYQSFDDLKCYKVCWDNDNFCSYYLTSGIKIDNKMRGVVFDNNWHIVSLYNVTTLKQEYYFLDDCNTNDYQSIVLTFDKIGQYPITRDGFIR